MTGYYDYTLVVASFVVAVLASYSALYFGAQLANLERGKARLWLTLGALSMGTGVWVMHFVGMQAYVMPVDTSYDLSITVVSWLAAVGASGLALYIIGKERIGNVQFAIGSLFMAGGIVSMHYVGMAALKMEPGMSYDPVHRKHKGMYQRLRNLPTQTEDGGVALTWRTGHSVFPSSGRNSRMLLWKAMKTAELSTLVNISVSGRADSPDQFGHVLHCLRHNGRLPCGGRQPIRIHRRTRDW